MTKTKKLPQRQEALTTPRNIITSRKILKLKKIKKVKRRNKIINSTKTKKLKNQKKCPKNNIESIFNINSHEKENLNARNSTNKQIALKNNIFNKSAEPNEIRFNGLYDTINRPPPIKKVEENIFSNFFNINDSTQQNQNLPTYYDNFGTLSTQNENNSPFDFNIKKCDLERKNISQNTTPPLDPFGSWINFLLENNNILIWPQEIRFQNDNSINIPQTQNNFSIANTHFPYLSNNQEINPNVNSILSPIYFNQNYNNNSSNINNRNAQNNNINNNGNNNNINNNNRLIQNEMGISNVSEENPNSNRNNNINDNNLEINNNISMNNNNIDDHIIIEAAPRYWYFNPNIRRIKKNLTKKKIEKVIDLEENKKNCMICLNEFKNGQNIYSLPCSHIFHIRCLNKEIKIRQKCPICRRRLKEKYK